MTEIIAPHPSFTSFKTMETTRYRGRRVRPSINRYFSGPRHLFHVNLDGIVNTDFCGRSDDWHFENVQIKIPIRYALEKPYADAYNSVRANGWEPDGDRKVQIYFKPLQCSYTGAINGIRDCSNSRDIGYLIDGFKTIIDNDLEVSGKNHRSDSESYLKLNVRLGAKDNAARIYRLSYNVKMLLYAYRTTYS